MKKFFAVILSVLLCALCVSCADNKAVNTNEPTELVTDSETTEHIISDEKYTSAEIKEPDFPVPYNFDECENYIAFPSFDKTEKSGNDENYLSDNVLVAKKTYNDDNKIMSVVIFDPDGETEKSKMIFEYASELSCDLENYSDGNITERFKFTYDTDGVIKSLYYNMPGETPVIEGYEFDKNGNVISFYDTSSISGIILDALASSISGGIN